MDFPGDTTVDAIGDQYLFGPALMINPVCRPGARSREVYLPAGQGWYELYSGKYMPGGRRIVAVAPYERIPVFVREGSILPIGPELQYSSEKAADPITLYVYTGKDAAFTLYEDEDINYHYEQGAYSRIPFTYNEAGGTLTIGAREGTYPGMAAQRTFNIKWIGKELAQPFTMDAPASLTVHYQGEKITIQKH
jgi:alpha-D-xyloside xylohydrolase